MRRVGPRPVGLLAFLILDFRLVAQTRLTIKIGGIDGSAALIADRRLSIFDWKLSILSICLQSKHVLKTEIGLEIVDSQYLSPVKARTEN